MATVTMTEHLAYMTHHFRRNKMMHVLPRSSLYPKITWNVPLHCFYTDNDLQTQKGWECCFNHNHNRNLEKLLHV